MLFWFTDDFFDIEKRLNKILADWFAIDIRLEAEPDLDRGVLGRKSAGLEGDPVELVVLGSTSRHR